MTRSKHDRNRNRRDQARQPKLAPPTTSQLLKAVEGIPGEIEFRPIALCQSEVDWLLKLSKIESINFPDGLLKRLVDLKSDFQDYVLKLKELITRMKANAFWIEDARATEAMIAEERKARREAMRDVVKEIQHLPASKLRILLSKEDRSNGKSKSHGKKRSKTASS